jgi:hypothetical protein
VEYMSQRCSLLPGELGKVLRLPVLCNPRKRKWGGCAPASAHTQLTVYFSSSRGCLRSNSLPSGSRNWRATLPIPSVSANS